MWRLREPFYTQAIIWVNTILNHIDTRAILPRNESFCMVYRPKCHKKQMILLNNHTLLVSKICEIHIIETSPSGLKNKTIPVQH